MPIATSTSNALKAPHESSASSTAPRSSAVGGLTSTCRLHLQPDEVGPAPADFLDRAGDADARADRRIRVDVEHAGNARCVAAHVDAQVAAAAAGAPCGARCRDDGVAQ